MVERETFACNNFEGAGVLKGKNIILIGFMGTGKTTIGKKTAIRLGLKFMDLDKEIVNYTGTSIPELFANRGEAYFRSVETQILRETLRQTGQLVSTGGGVVTQASNRQLINNSRQSGDLVIWLTASMETTWYRIKDDANRPLLKTTNPKEHIKFLLEARQPFYGQLADYTIDTSVLEPEEVTERIEGLFNRGGF